VEIIGRNDSEEARPGWELRLRSRKDLSWRDGLSSRNLRLSAGHRAKQKQRRRQMPVSHSKMPLSR